MKKFIVLTTINSPNENLKKIAESARGYGAELVIAGDAKTSEDFVLEGATFLSLKDQLDTKSNYALNAPQNNYCRKNIAYLYAMKNGAELILETDDDNIPYNNLFQEYEINQNIKCIEDLEWVNVFQYFTEELIWPRGFSLSDVKSDLPDFDSLPSKKLVLPIQSGLVDNDPDVDAIYRLLHKLPFNFSIKNRKIALGKRVWCSFNTQNTLFHREVFPLMYQPATPMFREADILRSFVIQRIMWENGWNLCFHSPTMYQERNEHDYIEDLKQEVRLYALVKEVCKELENLNIKAGNKYFKQNMIKCYEVYKKYNFISDLEFLLIENWFDEIKQIEHTIYKKRVAYL
jgi:hypothetical protein